MKKCCVFVMSLAFGALPVLALASSTTSKGAKAPETERIFSIDFNKKMVTIQGEKANATLPVEGKALAELWNVKPGEQAVVSYRDDAKGQHVAVTEIDPATSAVAKK